LCSSVRQHVTVSAEQPYARDDAGCLGDSQLEPRRFLVRSCVSDRPGNILFALLAAAVVILSSVEEIILGFLPSGQRSRRADEDLVLRDRVALDLLENDLEGNLVGGVWIMQLQLGILRIQV
jgi:hypothetical protein